MNLLKFMTPGICFGGSGGGSGGGGNDDRKPRPPAGKPNHSNSVGAMPGGNKTPSNAPRPPASETGTNPNKTGTGSSGGKGPVSAPSAPGTIGGQGSSNAPVTAPNPSDPVGGAGSGGERDGPSAGRVGASDVREANTRDRTQRVGSQKYRRGGIARPSQNTGANNRPQQAMRGNPFSMNKD